MMMTEQSFVELCNTFIKTILFSYISPFNIGQMHLLPYINIYILRVILVLWWHLVKVQFLTSPRWHLSGWHWWCNSQDDPIKLVLIAQGYTPCTSILHQENMSAIKLKINWHQPYGQCTCHHNVCYFLSRSRLIRDDMVANHYTKPL